MLAKSLNLILYRAAAELRSEGTRTYAGYLWWVLEPLLSLAVYYVAFKYIFNRGTDNLATFLFSGIVIYRFFAGTVTRSAISISTEHGLMNLVYIHKSVFPLSILLVNLIKFLLTFVLVLVAVQLSGISITWAYLAIPFLILLQMLLTAGVSMICAAIVPFFPDFQMILSTLLSLLIFLSGVFYNIKTLSPKMQNLLRLNPVAAIIEQYHAVLLDGCWPNVKLLLPATLESLILLAIGWTLIHKFNRYFPKIS
ncbi:MAG: hypothetical protein A2178_00355 [Planctomycetes bacterium GWC2_49_10]|nr:MAG: hypothetical protein A2178_00355 [Planctomycetes bacterium GWC2_49_10]